MSNEWWSEQDQDDSWIKQQEEELQRYDEESDEPLLADGFDAALIGFGAQFNQRLAVYDYDKCVAILQGSGMRYEDAVEWMEYNVVGAYMGRRTPVFIRVLSRKKRKAKRVSPEQLEFDF